MCFTIFNIASLLTLLAIVPLCLLNVLSPTFARPDLSTSPYAVLPGASESALGMLIVASVAVTLQIGWNVRWMLISSSDRQRRAKFFPGLKYLLATASTCAFLADATDPTIESVLLALSVVLMVTAAGCSAYVYVSQNSWLHRRRDMHLVADVATSIATIFLLWVAGSFGAVLVASVSSVTPSLFLVAGVVYMPLLLVSVICTVTRWDPVVPLSYAVAVALFTQSSDVGIVGAVSGLFLSGYAIVRRVCT